MNLRVRAARVRMGLDPVEIRLLLAALSRGAVDRRRISEQRVDVVVYVGPRREKALGVCIRGRSRRRVAGGQRFIHRLPRGVGHRADAIRAGLVIELPIVVFRAATAPGFASRVPGGVLVPVERLGDCPRDRIARRLHRLHEEGVLATRAADANAAMRHPLVIELEPRGATFAGDDQLPTPSPHPAGTPYATVRSERSRL